MNSKPLKRYFFFLFLLLPLFLSPASSAERSKTLSHPFLPELKAAYTDSNFSYREKTEEFLFRKLSQSNGRDQLNLKKEKEKDIVDRTIESLMRQFFRKVKTGGNYCDPGEIKKKFGESPQESIGISSGGYYRLFVAYWTFRAKLERRQSDNAARFGRSLAVNFDLLLNIVNQVLSGAFFPRPGPLKVKPPQRRKAVEILLEKYAPEITVEELFQGADPQKSRWPIIH